MWHLIKDAAFRDNPPNPAWTTDDPEIDRLIQTHSTDQPEVHEVIAGMRRVLEEFEDRVLIGEIRRKARRLLRQKPHGRASAVQLPASEYCLDGAPHRRANREL
jgi:hypothetical protein